MTYFSSKNIVLFIVILFNWFISSAIVSAEIASNKTNNHSTTFAWMLGYNFAPLLINMIILLFVLHMKLPYGFGIEFDQ
jgi:TRAP-type C4-dicarboxylate transport system permease small subunit